MAAPQLQARDRVVFGDDERRFVYAVARRIVRSETDAEDVTQEALLLAYRHRHAFRGDARYKTWLYRIASTTALGHLRKAKRLAQRVVADDGQAELHVADPARSPEADVADREIARLARAAIDRLDPKYRDVFLMRAEDAPEAEVAEAMGISVPNVKIRAHRARHRLRGELAALVA
ncbi:MAG: sigma-70 family RNA polymerase sigma factor [Myxococcales bacterium]|nr:sigma-70 family RNA polymerase sigma factor [Myxococcales bacterium]